MPRFHGVFAGLLVVAALSGSHSRITIAEERPNILWISCEDISSHLGCYGDPVATTPHLDQLATEGVRYTHAFTCHGVCAPSRTGIITAVHPISTGANHMRSKVTLPDHIRCFPEYLRQAGYYCTNNSKTDYNFRWDREAVWDESSRQAHWKKRPDSDQPFFAVFNLTMCHESRIWPENWKSVTKDFSPALFHDPDNVTVPELYPDTPKVRAAIARLHDVITAMDQRAGEILRELEDAGLTDDTIVIFWSDHGNGFARAKRWIYDTGTRVPMIARIPEQFRTNGQGEPGSVDDQLISLIDLGPTMLNLAGVPLKDHFHGQPFLGPDLPEPRKYIYGARDRIDERSDLVRSVRDRRYRYVRNMMPWLPVLQHVRYSERSVTRQELRRVHAADSSLEPAAHLLTVPRPAEELYDLQADPLELHNLAQSPQHRSELQRLRNVCDQWQRDTRDAHLIPESILIDEERTQPSRWHVFHGEQGAARWETVFAAALNRSTTPATFESTDSAVRWWAMAHGSEDPQDLLPGLTDESPAVRLAAARSLHPLPQYRPRIADVLAELLLHPQESVRHAAILTVDELDGMGAALRDPVTTLHQANSRGYIHNVAEHIVNGPVSP